MVSIVVSTAIGGHYVQLSILLVTYGYLSAGNNDISYFKIKVSPTGSVFTDMAMACMATLLHMVTLPWHGNTAMT